MITSLIIIIHILYHNIIIIYAIIIIIIFVNPIITILSKKTNLNIIAANGLHSGTRTETARGCFSKELLENRPTNHWCAQLCTLRE